MKTTIINAIRTILNGKNRRSDSSEAPTVIPNIALPEIGTTVIGEQLEHEIISYDIKGLTDENLSKNDQLIRSVESFSMIANNSIVEMNLPDKLPVNENNQESMIGVDNPEISIIEPEEMIFEMEKELPSLLDNRIFIKLVEECVDIMNEFESFIDRMETDEGREVAQMIVRRLQESLERLGLSRIDDVNVPFSILLHNPEPMMPVADGEALEKVLLSGLKIENRVFRKAKVQISVL